MTTESIIPIIRSEAIKFCDENFVNPTEADYFVIYNAMLRATNICLNKETERYKSEIKNMKEEILKEKI